MEALFSSVVEVAHKDKCSVPVGGLLLATGRVKLLHSERSISIRGTCAAHVPGQIKRGNGSAALRKTLETEQGSGEGLLPAQSGGCPVQVPLVVQCLVVRPDVLNPSQHA